MAARKSGLGRGLDALLPQDRPVSGYAELPVDAIGPNPKQPRREFDQKGIDALAASIKAVGLLQPIVVRTDGSNYVLVAGERRLRASKQAGLKTIAAIVREQADDEANLTEALVENLQREDLNVLEEAAAFRLMLDDYGMTHDQVGQFVGKSRSAVSNTLRLLQLPAEIQALLMSGELSAGHARVFAGAEDETYAVRIATLAAAEGWNVRKVEQAMKDGGAPRRKGRSGLGAVRPAAIIELEERLRDRLETGVTIDYRGRGGKITIKYSSPEDLERIYRHLFEGN